MSYIEAKRICTERESDLDWNFWTFDNAGLYREIDYINLRIRGVDTGVNVTEEEYSENLKKLEIFCKEHNLFLYGGGSSRIVQNSYSRFFTQFYLTVLQTHEENNSGFGILLPHDSVVICACGTENNQHNIFCSDCEVRLRCASCEIDNQNWLSNSVFRGSATESFALYHEDLCISCATTCVNCGAHWYDSSGGYNSECFDCHPRFNCQNCGDYQDGEESDRGLCDRCSENICDSCEDFFSEENNRIEDPENGTVLCQRCFNGLDRNNEIFDNDSEMPATRLAIPTITGRERIRFCGLEIEGINVTRNAHDILAMDLYDQDLSGFDSRRGYHERYDGGFAHIERDSSCDWEAVIGPINMASTVEVRKLNQVIKVIRNRIQEKTVKLSLNCGLHIHVSAEKVGIEQAHNLHLLYTYLEDVIYRLGAAKWPMHRAVVNGDHSYQISPRETNKLRFVNRYLDNRYYGLSFSNYFQRMLNSCGCGAGRFGMFDECTCTLHKCTFEFRVFNTTANTKKIHAYMALTQAMISKAFNMREFDVEEMQHMPFNLRNHKDMNSTQQEEIEVKWIERMKFILEELPLTDEERYSILYCVESSEIAPIMGYCEEIVNNQTEVDDLFVG